MAAATGGPLGDLGAPTSIAEILQGTEWAGLLLSAGGEGAVTDFGVITTPGVFNDFATRSQYFNPNAQSSQQAQLLGTVSLIPWGTVNPRAAYFGKSVGTFALRSTPGVGAALVLDDPNAGRLAKGVALASVFALGGAIFEGVAESVAAEGVEVAEGASQGASFNSFRAFKGAVGPAGEDAQWHHIVEQTPGNLARFGPGPIQNTGNLIRLDVATHQQISGFYSSIQPFTGGATVRSWLSTQPFEIQKQFGQEVLLRFGVSF